SVRMPILLLALAFAFILEAVFSQATNVRLLNIIAVITHIFLFISPLLLTGNRLKRGESPASPLARDSFTKILNRLAYFPFRSAEVLLHLAFGTIGSSTLLKFAVAG